MTKLCIDCKFYRFGYETPEGVHWCTYRQKFGYEKSLVTGEMVRKYTDSGCEQLRTNRYQECGPYGKWFEPK